MIVLFAPAKTFRDINATIDKTLLFDEKTKELINNLKKWDYEMFKKSFNISDEITKEVVSYYQDFDNNPSFLAFDFFYGQSFQSFDFDTLDKKNYSFLNSNVFIIDALYGIIKPLDPIRKYRLDFHTKNLSLKSFWKEEVNTFFKQYFTQEILSLSSKEFTSLLDKSLNVVDVSFFDYIDNSYKQISVFNKQMRGKLLRYIVDNKIESISDLPRIINYYEVSEEKSTNRSIVYVRK